MNNNKNVKNTDINNNKHVENDTGKKHVNDNSNNDNNNNTTLRIIMVTLEPVTMHNQQQAAMSHRTLRQSYTIGQQYQQWQ